MPFRKQPAEPISMKPSVRLFRCIPYLKRASSKTISAKDLSAWRQASAQQGFALPIAIGLGLVMTVIGITTIFVAQNDRSTAVQRRESGSGLFVAEGGIARMLAQFQKPNNSLLMVRNYDTINPATHKTYLGPDGVPNSGDEENDAMDQWTGYDLSAHACFQAAGVRAPNFVQTGSIGTAGTYTLKAYRYDQAKKLGTVLIEGNHQGQSSFVSVTFSIEPVLDDFPGVMLFDHDPSNTYWQRGVLALRGRHILGSKGNVYYNPSSSPDPSLTGVSQPGGANRLNYLNAVWSSTNDGASSDTVDGKIFACKLTPNIPVEITGTNPVVIDTSTTLRGTGGVIPTVYQVSKIDLAGTEILEVDTTNGPVHINIVDSGAPGNNPDLAITLRNTAKVINTRSDGQLPRVGDLRIMLRGNSQTNLYDRTCIQNAFLYSMQDELRILTSGPGCPGGKNTNFEGVVWVQAAISSKNSSGNRNVNYITGNSGTQYDTTVTPGATSGIAVSENVSSLTDLIESIDWPVRYRIGQIRSWQRIRL
jgi:hypothetical protein